MAAQIFDTYLHTLGKTEEQWRNEMLQEALFQAKIHLMLDAIAENGRKAGSVRFHPYTARWRIQTHDKDPCKIPY